MKIILSLHITYVYNDSDWNVFENSIIQIKNKNRECRFEETEKSIRLLLIFYELLQLFEENCAISYLYKSKAVVIGYFYMKRKRAFCMYLW